MESVQAVQAISSITVLTRRESGQMRRYAGVHCEIYDLSWFLDAPMVDADGKFVKQARPKVAKISRRVVNRGVALVTSLVRGGALSTHNIMNDGYVLTSYVTACIRRQQAALPVLLFWKVGNLDPAPQRQLASVNEWPSLAAYQLFCSMDNTLPLANHQTVSGSSVVGRRFLRI